MKRFAILTIGALALAAPAWAQEIKATVIAGRPTKVSWAVYLNPDCTRIGKTEFRFVALPTHGKVTIRDGRDFPIYPESNVRHVCNKRAVPSVQIWYQAPRNFVGTDRFRTIRIESDGSTLEREFLITVVQ
ncbi:MAG TPA: hypothetical protein VIL09_10285 [Microvirga sp.]